MLDNTDIEIIKILENDSRITCKDIGETVHLTGQAVAGRIKRLEQQGIITRFSINIDSSKLFGSLTSYVTVYMKTTDHNAFHRFLKRKTEIKEAHRISGDGCYMLKIVTADNELLALLDEILLYGNYKVSTSIAMIK